MRQEPIDNNIPVFHSTIRRAAGFQKAALEGIPIRDISDTRSRIGWLDYQALGREIMEVLKNC